jgi:hypothetical protein
VEKSPVLAIEKIQDAQICWQSDGYGVLETQGCTVGGFRGKKPQQSKQSHILQPQNSYEQPFNDNALHCS